jgi:hypothetical protein
MLMAKPFALQIFFDFTRAPQNSRSDFGYLARDRRRLSRRRNRLRTSMFSRQHLKPASERDRGSNLAWAVTDAILEVGGKVTQIEWCFEFAFDRRETPERQCE